MGRSTAPVAVCVPKLSWRCIVQTDSKSVCIWSVNWEEGSVLTINSWKISPLDPIHECAVGMTVKGVRRLWKAPQNISRYKAAKELEARR